jgi:hypothetical protein
MHSLAKTYRQRGLEVAEQLQDDYTLGQVLSICSLYDMGLGQWDRVVEFVTRATGIARSMGDHRLWETGSGMEGLAYAYQGEYEKSLNVFSEVYASSRRSGNTQTYIWGTLGTDFPAPW